MDKSIQSTLFYIFTYVFSSTIQVNASSLQETRSLYDTLFQNYSTEMRPVLDQTKAVKINATIDLLAINDFDELAGVLSMAVKLRLNWYDEQLTWNVAHNNIAFLTVSQEKVWFPKLFLANPANKVKPLSSKHFKVSFTSNGLVTWHPFGILQATCSPNILNYPYDSQTCTFGLIPMGYTAPEVSLSFTDGFISTDKFSENAEWEVGATSAIANWVDSPYSVGVLSMVLKRRSLNFVINVIIPIIMIVVLTPFVFLLPHSSGERVSYTITILLSFSVYMTVVSDKMPNSSLPVSVLSYFLLTCLFVSMIVVTINVFQMRVYDKDDSIPIPKHVKTFVNFFRRFHRNKIGGNWKKEDTKKMSQDDDKYGMDTYSTHVNTGDDKRKIINTTLLRLESIGDDEFGTKNKKELSTSDQHRNQPFNQKDFDDDLTWHTVATTMDMFYFFLFFIGGLCYSLTTLVLIRHVL